MSLQQMVFMFTIFVGFIYGGFGLAIELDCNQFKPGPEQLCCDGKVKFGNLCCGQNGYYKETSVCCDGVVLPISGSNTDCCEKQNYSPKTLTCCEGKILIGNSCCGPKPYFSQTHICCDGVLNSRAYGDLCCGNTNYNSFTKRCCSNNFTISVDLKC